MVTPEMLDFIRAGIEGGMPLSELRRLLVTEGGWEEGDIAEALHELGVAEEATVVLTPETTPAPTPTPSPEPQRAIHHELSTPEEIHLAPTPPHDLVSAVARSPKKEIETPPLPAPAAPTGPSQVTSPAPIRIEEEVSMPVPPGEPVFITDGVISEELPEEQYQSAEAPLEDTAAEEASAEPKPDTHAPPPQSPVEDFLGIFKDLFAGAGERSAPAPAPQVSARPPSTEDLPKERLHTMGEIIPPKVDTAKAESPAPFVQKPETLPPKVDMAKTESTPPPTQKPETDLSIKKSPLAELLAGKPPPAPLPTLPSKETPADVVKQVPPQSPPKIEQEKEPESAPTAAKITFSMDALRKAAESAAGTAAKISSRAVTPTGVVLSENGEQPKSKLSSLLTGNAPEEKQASSGHYALPGKRTMASDILHQGELKSAQTPKEAPPKDESKKPQYPVHEGVKVLIEGEKGVTSPLGAQGMGGEIKKVSPAATGGSVHKKPASPAEAKNSGRAGTGSAPQGKRPLVVSALTLVLIVAFSAAAYYFFIHKQALMRGDIEKAAARLLSAPGFSYHAETKTDLALSGAEDGLIRFDGVLSGSLASGVLGFGDGTHRLSLKGGIEKGNFVWSTDMEADVIRVGENVYLKALKVPESSDADGEVLGRYWIRYLLRDIASELGISPGATDASPSPVFGDTLVTIPELLRFRFVPALVVGKGAPELEDNADPGLSVYAISIEPDAGIEFIRSAFAYYRGKELVFTEEERIRIADAIKKFSGALWISEVGGGSVARITLTANLDDEIFGVRAAGPVSVDIRFTDIGVIPKVETPDSIVDTSELETLLRTARERKQALERDNDRTRKAGELVIALEAYRTKIGRYPTALSEIESGGYLASTSISGGELIEFPYVSYASERTMSKSGRCTARSKTCAAYHLGVSLETFDHPSLKDDPDRSGEIFGGDGQGCSGEAGKYCYDIVVPAPPKTSTEGILP